ncbi:hypothetical protein [Neisseria lactamica]|uniref:hypothetical protein n=1 Tax=Neisseria lactamica TaxID=486 RepID=UPI0027E00A56|nr:hypothetical protein [Neisseria lactamica]
MPSESLSDGIFYGIVLLKNTEWTPDFLLQYRCFIGFFTSEIGMSKTGRRVLRGTPILKDGLRIFRHKIAYVSTHRMTHKAPPYVSS